MVGKSFAGAPYEGDWPSMTTVRIMTGAKIPEGCDAVIMQENTTVDGDNITFNQCSPKTNMNIRPTGDDIRVNDVVLKKGARLTARDIPMIATLGISHISVFRKPVVCFLFYRR